MFAELNDSGNNLGASRSSPRGGLRIAKGSFDNQAPEAQPIAPPESKQTEEEFFSDLNNA